MSHYKTTRLTDTTRRATGRSTHSSAETKHRTVLLKAVLILAIGAFVFMAASTL